MFREHKYRIHLVAFGLFLTGLFIVAVEIERAIRGVSRHLWQSGPNALALLASMWVLAFVVWAAFPGYAGPERLRATDGIGRYHDVRWSDIRKATSVFGFLWIKHGGWGTGLCFPKFLEDWKGFREYVLAHAPEDNLLKVALQRGT